MKRSAQVERMQFALGSLFMVIEAAGKSGALTAFQAEGLREEALDLMQQLDQGMEGGAKVLNGLIAKYNGFVATPFPTFVEDNLTVQVQGDVAAFQLYLIHEMNGRQMSAAQEAPLFQEASDLWASVGAHGSPCECVECLQQLIKKAHALLPQETPYPLPNKSFF